MSLVEKIKVLCKRKNTNIAELERNIGISNGQIRKWDESNPGIDKVRLVADHFHVSLDYLVGRTNYYDLTDKDERDIQKELQNLIQGLNNKDGLAAFDGQTLEDLDDEDKELLVASLENSLRLAKRLAKEKFTPKKYRK